MKRLKGIISFNLKNGTVEKCAVQGRTERGFYRNIVDMLNAASKEIGRVNITDYVYVGDLSVKVDRFLEGEEVVPNKGKSMFLKTEVTKD
jgi:hypothetical protein